jgi:DNA-binding response OmpR family regulator
MTPIESALSDQAVLLSVTDSGMAAVLSDAIGAEGMRANFFSGIEEAQKLLAKDRPSLVILEHDRVRIDGMRICRAIR